MRKAVTRSTSALLRDAGRALLAASHNTLALVGLAVVAAALFLATRPDVRHTIETTALGWLQARHAAQADATAPSQAVAVVAPVLRDPSPAVVPTPVAAAELVSDAKAIALAVAPTATEAGAVNRATATDPKDLTRQQSAVALWLARRYRVAPEPVSRLVKEAWAVAPRVGLDPTLVLAIMAIESSFNPFAQSSVGAQGLMQVMTRVHDSKYARFGGVLAAFDPVSNLKVGVQVLKECIARAGSVEAGLRHYVGAANLSDDGGYAGKVLAEQSYLRSVADGKMVAPTTRVAQSAAPVAAAVVLRNAPVRAGTVPAPTPSPAKADDETPAPEQVALG